MIKIKEIDLEPIIFIGMMGLFTVATLAISCNSIQEIEEWDYDDESLIRETQLRESRRRVRDLERALRQKEYHLGKLRQQLDDSRRDRRRRY